MHTPAMNYSVAVFFDSENLAYGTAQHGMPHDLGAIIARVREEGRLTSARAYGDWSSNVLGNYLQDYRESVVEMVQLATDVRGKNTADISMVVDALEMALLPSPPEMFVIVSGDRDFVPLVQKLKRHGRVVIGIGPRGCVHDGLTRVVDNFLYLDDIVYAQVSPPAGVPGTLAPTPVPSQTAATAEDVREGITTVVRAAIILERQGEIANGQNLARVAKQLDPAFDYARLGYPTIRHLALEADADGLLHVSVYEDGEFRAEPRSTDGYDVSTPQAAKTTYHDILYRRKRVFLLAREARAQLVSATIDQFAASPNGLTRVELFRTLTAAVEWYGITTNHKTLEKLVMTINMANVFSETPGGPGRFFWSADDRVHLSTDSLTEIMDAMDYKYLSAISEAAPDLALVPDGVALWLFEALDDENISAARGLIRRVHGTGDDIEAVDMSPLAAALTSALHKRETPEPIAVRKIKLGGGTL